MTSFNLYSEGVFFRRYRDTLALQYMCLEFKQKGVPYEVQTREGKVLNYY